MTATFCKACGTYTNADTTCTCGTYNPARGATTTQRRARDGRNTRSWQRTRTLVLERDGNRCTHCGGTATNDDHLVVHKMNGGMHTADLASYRTMHNSCHSRLHAGQREGGVSKENGSPPASTRRFPVQSFGRGVS